ncbi:HAD-IA family hydrolase [Roseibium sp.]|uniref:HAD-IA family hydrolase n=1 Tax=Roseibium sp. TaxID=1936156 RepID=UPI003A97288C
MSIKALVFDVDGTLAETEELHRIAFNQAFEEAGLPWHWSSDLYEDLLKVTGGRERIHAHAEATAFQDIDAAGLHTRKTEIYNELIAAGSIAPRRGIETLISEGRSQGLRLAIATTTSRANVVGLFQATFGRELLSAFSSIRTGEDVTIKKPAPEVYLKVLRDLALAPNECLAFEDSFNGVTAAKTAGLRCVASPAKYTKADRLDQADHVVSCWREVRLDDFIAA